MSQVIRRRIGRRREAVAGGGTFTHGGSYTVTGTGFGTKSTAAPLKYDDFQSVTVGSDITTSTATGPSWVNNGGAAQTFNPTASSTRLRSGTPFTRNMRSRWQATGGTDPSASSVAVIGQSFTKCLVDWWQYYDSSNVTGTVMSNQKPIRIHQNGAGSPNCYPNFYGRASTDASTAGGRDMTPDETDGNFFASSDGGTNGVEVPGSAIHNHWTHWTFMVDAGSGNAAFDGSIMCYVDASDSSIVARYDHDLAHFGGVRTIGSGFFTWTEIYIGNYTRSGDWQTGVDAFNYIECAYIDTSWARVEIGDNATYTSCTHREIQYPTAWSDTSVTFTVNRGSFGVGNTVHIHVVDSTNTPHYVGSQVLS